ncbi:hypothetical protein PPERSA_04748 [Pseudocohnilembus persalinus]|uniref:Uncharacterized protein n=1 Tax=Pseudocohnilembus persalinus TaxID=266149 RepID=A0A0V0QNN1_PSEPJ|nr:hypothetical protein PPERSA_04748 [Pseudocohnilembus persalinus]|eukprot:KRX03870.1 hypothetical protein PPERSA_04748 [Pseudocohnilembus persalinus]
MVNNNKSSCHICNLNKQELDFFAECSIKRCQFLFCEDCILNSLDKDKKDIFSVDVPIQELKNIKNQKEKKILEKRNLFLKNTIINCENSPYNELEQTQENQQQIKNEDLKNEQKNEQKNEDNLQEKKDQSQLINGDEQIKNDKNIQIQSNQSKINVNDIEFYKVQKEGNQKNLNRYMRRKKILKFKYNLNTQK